MPNHATFYAALPSRYEGANSTTKHRRTRPSRVADSDHLETRHHRALAVAAQTEENLVAADDTGRQRSRRCTKPTNGRCQESKQRLSEQGSTCPGPTVHVKSQDKSSISNHPVSLVLERATTRQPLVEIPAVSTGNRRTCTCLFHLTASLLGFRRGSHCFLQLALPRSSVHQNSARPRGSGPMPARTLSNTGGRSARCRGDKAAMVHRLASLTCGRGGGGGKRAWRLKRFR